MKKPRTTFNPLLRSNAVFPHLLQAIGHRLAHSHPHLRIQYLSTEKFTNELIAAIRYDMTPEFRQPYRTIDLLLTDVVMPGMNGRELAERLSELQPGVKVLFMSGYTEDVIVHHGVVDEHVHFIGKPYSLAGLAAKIRETLEG